MILDGFGIAGDYGNAIKAANKPNIDRLFSSNPITQIGASGMDVGLPDGQMGNSEVGHTNIGGGRVVFQDLPRITRSIETVRSLKIPPTTRRWTTALERLCAAPLRSALHRRRALHARPPLRAFKDGAHQGLKRVYIHAFLDGARHAPRPPAATLSQRPWKSAVSSASARSRPLWAAITRWTATSAGTASRTPMTRSSTARACRTATHSRHRGEL